MIILKSASRIVLIIMTLALCLFTYLWQVDWKDFVVLISVVFTYYFTKNGSATPPQKSNSSDIE